MSAVRRFLHRFFDALVDGQMIRARIMQNVLPPVPEEDLQRCISSLRSQLHDIKRWGTSLNGWKRISPVKVTTKFGGWGFVEGRTEAFEIDNDVHLFEYDECMDFTSAVLLIDGVPCLDLTSRGGKLTITLLAGQDYFDEILSPSGMPLMTVHDLRQMAEPVQHVLLKVLSRVMQAEALKTDAIETLIKYKERA